jgi:hypothetical protein
MEPSRAATSACAGVARELMVQLGIDAAEFVATFPERAESQHTDRISFAKVAATLLRQLKGYLGGVTETVAIDEQLSLEQIAAAREATGKPLGFA